MRRTGAAAPWRPATSVSSVQRIWRAHGLKPLKVRAWLWRRTRAYSGCKSAHEVAAEGAVDHRLGDVQAGLVVAHQTAPADQMADAVPDHLDREVEEGSLVEQPAAVVGGIAEQVLEPGPALAERRHDELGGGAVGEVSRGQVHHQQPAVGVPATWRLRPLIRLWAS